MSSSMSRQANFEKKMFCANQPALLVRRIEESDSVNSRGQCGAAQRLDEW